MLLLLLSKRKPKTMTKKKKKRKLSFNGTTLMKNDKKIYLNLPAKSVYRTSSVCPSCLAGVAPSPTSFTCQSANRKRRVAKMARASEFICMLLTGALLLLPIIMSLQRQHEVACRRSETSSFIASGDKGFDEKGATLAELQEDGAPSGFQAGFVGKLKAENWVSI